MARQLTADDAKQSLTGHVTHKGLEVFAKYGPRLGWTQLQQLLNDRAYVRYPCDIIFDTAALHEGEFAHPEPKGATPEAGFTMFVHPVYMLDLERVPALVLYQLVALNYGGVCLGRRRGELWRGRAGPDAGRVLRSDLRTRHAGGGRRR